MCSMSCFFHLTLVLHVGHKRGASHASSTSHLTQMWMSKSGFLHLISDLDVQHVTFLRPHQTSSYLFWTPSQPSPHPIKPYHTPTAQRPCDRNIRYSSQWTLTSLNAHNRAPQSLGWQLFWYLRISRILVAILMWKTLNIPVEIYFYHLFVGTYTTPTTWANGKSC